MNRNQLCLTVTAMLCSACVPALGQAAVIPLKGHVGHLLSSDRDITQSFDAPYVDHAISAAQEAGATTVVLHIKSDAGYAYERNAVCDVINKWRDDMNIVAYLEDARSAAATIALSCDTIVVGPACRLGVGLALDAATGNTVDERWLQTEAATIRSYIQQAGRDGNIADALAIEELQLWWHADFGFSIPTTTRQTSTTENERSTTRGDQQSERSFELRDRYGTVQARIDSAGNVTWQSETRTTRQRETREFENEGTLDESAWRKVDGEFSLLTLTGRDVIDLGLAKAVARDVKQCLEILEIAEPVDIGSKIDLLARTRIRKGKQAGRKFASFEDQLARLDRMHADLRRAEPRALVSERRKLMKTVFRMCKDAGSLQKIAEHRDQPLSFCPIELCQLRESARLLERAHDQFKELDDEAAGREIAAAIESWQACRTVS